MAPKLHLQNKEGSSVSEHTTKNLISILMESPLYLTLPVKERHSLLMRLTESYPFLTDGEEEKIERGCESSLVAIN